MKHSAENQNSHSAAPHGNLPFARRRDIVIVAALLLACVGLFFVLRQRPAGAVAAITLPNSADTQAQLIPLDKDGTYHINEGALPVTLEVENGAIRFVRSVCPDHDCEGFGWLRREGEWALCAPAGVMVTVRQSS